MGRGKKKYFFACVICKVTSLTYNTLQSSKPSYTFVSCSQFNPYMQNMFLGVFFILGSTFLHLRSNHFRILFCSITSFRPSVNSSLKFANRYMNTVIPSPRSMLQPLLRQVPDPSYELT